MGHKIPEGVEWVEDRPFSWSERHQELQDEGPRGCPDPSCPPAQPHSRAGRAPGQRGARGRSRAGSSWQPGSRWGFLPVSPLSKQPVCRLFPLRAVSCEGSSSRPHSIKHKGSSIPEHTALEITSAHSSGLKHSVRDRSVPDISLSLSWESLPSPGPAPPVKDDLL